MITTSNVIRGRSYDRMEAKSTEQTRAGKFALSFWALLENVPQLYFDRLFMYAQN